MKLSELLSSHLDTYLELEIIRTDGFCDVRVDSPDYDVNELTNLDLKRLHGRLEVIYLSFGKDEKVGSDVKAVNDELERRQLKADYKKMAEDERDRLCFNLVKNVICVGDKVSVHSCNALPRNLRGMEPFIDDDDIELNYRDRMFTVTGFDDKSRRVIVKAGRQQFIAKDELHKASVDAVGSLKAKNFDKEIHVPYLDLFHLYDGSLYTRLVSDLYKEPPKEKGDE